MPRAANYANVTVRRQGHVAIVTFHRPAKANALDHAHLADIEAAALAFREDVETRAVVFTGAGRHFSSGADLRAGAALPSGADLRAVPAGADLRGAAPAASGLLERRRLARMGERATMAVHDMDQITIAAWNGAAMGGGAVLATAMDLRIGAADCFMQYPEIDIGVNLMWKGLPLIARLVGPARAKRLVAGGERVHAEQLADWGVLDAVAPPDALLDTALEWAARYAAKPPIPAQMIKRSVNAIVGAADGAVMHMDVDQNLLTAATADRATAAAAWRARTLDRSGDGNAQTPPTFHGD